MGRMGLASPSEGLETLRVDPAAPTSELPEPIEPGSKLGRYAVLDEIGLGGMGRVLRAYDTKLQREVALKEVRPRALGAESRQRLISEARAMAKLSHENVVAVYDVYVDGPQLVLVMELVVGTTLKQWLADDRPTWPTIVDRFVAAGRGLAAAHEVGLMHRDFKPANVMVGEGTVKVTDFGLAKPDGSTTSGGSASPVVSDPYGLTQDGMVVGTPRYMAPEQHLGQRLTAATDQYAFCVALWEALRGSPPFGGTRDTTTESIVQDKLAGPPVFGSADVPRRITDALRRGLAVKPEHRFDSMRSLIDALAPSSTGRRTRWLLAAGAVGALGVAFVVLPSAADDNARCTGGEAELVGTWDADRKRAVEGAFGGLEPPWARSGAPRITATLDEYAAQWVDEYGHACEATMLRGEQSERMMDLRMSCLRRAQHELAAVTELLTTADEETAREAPRLVRGLPPLDRCHDLDALQADVEPPSKADAATVDEVRATIATAKAQRSAAHFDDARATLDRAEGRLTQIDYLPVTHELRLEQGLLQETLGDYETAQATLEEVLQGALGLRQWDVVEPAALRLMVVIGVRRKMPDEALRYRELVEGLATKDTRTRASLHNAIANILLVQGSLSEAEREMRTSVDLHEQAYGAEHLSTAGAHNNLGNVLLEQGRYAEAEAEYQRAQRVRTVELGEHHPEVAQSLSNLAATFEGRGMLDDAESANRRALELRLAAYGALHPSVASSRMNLSNVLHSRGQLEDAVAELRLVLESYEARGEADHPEASAARINLSPVLVDLKRYDEAVTEARRARRALAEALGDAHPYVGIAGNNLAVALHQADRLDEAEQALREAIPVLREALGDDDDRVADARFVLSSILLQRGRAKEALPIVEAAWAQRQQSEMGPDAQAAARFLVARALRVARPDDASTQARAKMLAGEALELYEDAGERRADDAQDIRDWLADPTRP